MKILSDSKEKPRKGILSRVGFFFLRFHFQRAARTMQAVCAVSRGQCRSWPAALLPVDGRKEHQELFLTSHTAGSALS